MDRIKQHFIFFVLALSLVLVHAMLYKNPVYAAEGFVRFGSDGYTHEDGESFNVGVYVHSTEGVGAHYIILAYDPSILEYQGGATSADTENGLIAIVADLGNGQEVQNYMLSFRALHEGDSGVAVASTVIYTAGMPGEVLEDGTEIPEIPATECEITEMDSAPIHIGVAQDSADQTAPDGQDVDGQNAPNGQDNTDQNADDLNQDSLEANDGINVDGQSSEGGQDTSVQSAQDGQGDRPRTDRTDDTRADDLFENKDLDKDDEPYEFVPLMFRPKVLLPVIFVLIIALVAGSIYTFHYVREYRGNSGRQTGNTEGGRRTRLGRANQGAPDEGIIETDDTGYEEDFLNLIPDNEYDDEHLDEYSQDRRYEMPVISVRDITMVFKLATYTPSGLKDYVIRLLKREISYRKLYALYHVTFDVYKGEVVGIIGTNGSGKSTLLKIISGALVPSSGKVVVDRRKIQLLTLGTGFDAELTGRENVYLNGSIIGYSREFLDKHYSEIVEFAELQDYMEQPVKNYSSGMVSRLGFAIATAGDAAEILILDEVLSVGDEFFRKKSLARIKEMIHGGSTVLMVSHGMDTIINNCSVCIWIEKGELRMIGGPKEVCSAYRNMEKSEATGTIKAAATK